MDARRDGARFAASSSRTPGMSLAEQAEMFGSLATSSPDGVVATDADAKVVWVNSAAAAIFDLAPDELLRRPVTDLVHEEARPRLATLHRQVIAGEHPGPFSTSALRRDGRGLDLSVTPAVRRDDRGRAVGATMVLRDVTEETRLRRELAEAVARSRARFDQSAQPQALLDVEGRFVEVNAAVCELLGRRRDELVGHDSTDVVHPTDPDRVRHLLDRLRLGPVRSATHETTVVHRDGRLIPILVDITAVRDPDGKADEFAVFGRDLRELREAERRLTSQEAFFRGLHREAADVTLVADAAGEIRYVTPSVTQVLGYEPEQMRALATSLVHPDDVAGAEERRRRVLEMPGTRERETLWIKDAEGRWRWFDTAATNCLHEPDITGIVINLREVTPEIEAQQALRDSEARYRAIAETAQEGILAVSPEGDTSSPTNGSPRSWDSRWRRSTRSRHRDLPLRRRREGRAATRRPAAPGRSRAVRRRLPAPRRQRPRPARLRKSADRRRRLRAGLRGDGLRRDRAACRRGHSPETGPARCVDRAPEPAALRRPAHPGRRTAETQPTRRHGSARP